MWLKIAGEVVLLGFAWLGLAFLVSLAVCSFLTRHDLEARTPRRGGQ